MILARRPPTHVDLENLEYCIIVPDTQLLCLNFFFAFERIQRVNYEMTLHTCVVRHFVRIIVIRCFFFVFLIYSFCLLLSFFSRTIPHFIRVHCLRFFRLFSRTLLREKKPDGRTSYRDDIHRTLPKRKTRGHHSGTTHTGHTLQVDVYRFKSLEFCGKSKIT